jgi:hypothetical protein
MPGATLTNASAPSNERRRIWLAAFGRPDKRSIGKVYKERRYSRGGMPTMRLKTREN